MFQKLLQDKEVSFLTSDVYIKAEEDRKAAETIIKTLNQINRIDAVQKENQKVEKTLNNINFDDCIDCKEPGMSLTASKLIMCISMLSEDEFNLIYNKIQKIKKERGK